MNKENRDVVKSNALVEASYHPASLYQMRLLLAALAQIKAMGKIDHEKDFEVTAGGMADLIGAIGSAGSYYKQLKRAADELMEMIITVDKNPDGSSRKRGYRRINVVSHCDYIEGEAKIVLRFTPSIIPYISDLHELFTRYKLKYVMSMRSAYGIRLYELCLQWADFRSEVEFEVDEFRHVMGLDGKYERMDHLKTKVIKPALRDVNAHTDLAVTYGERRRGRAITHFQFKYQKKQTVAAMPDRSGQKGRKTAGTRALEVPGAALPYLEGPDWQARRSYIEENARAGEDWTQAKERLTKELRRGIIREVGEIIQ